jgi:hypothetical protein
MGATSPEVPSAVGGAMGMGEKADWKAVDTAMLQAAAMAEKVAAFRHPRLADTRIVGEPPRNPTDGTLDELLERIKAGLERLSPVIDLEVVREPRGSRTKAA